MNPWDEIFGEVPTSFENRVHATLRDLEEPAMKHTNHYKTQTRKTMKRGLTALVAAVLVLALCGVGYAVVSYLDFYNIFFGTGAVEGDTVVEAHEFSYEDEEKGTITYTVPGYELVEVDEEAAERLLGTYMTGMGQSYTAENGTTLTILNYIEDEAGSYRLYYSIENPEGLENVEYYDVNGYTGVSGDWGFRISTAGSMSYTDAEKNTQTAVYVCVPGVVKPWEKNGVEVRIYPDGAESLDEEVLRVTADEKVPAMKAEGGNYEISVSPMGIRVAQKEAYPDNVGFQAHYVSITMKDGSEYLVLEKDVTDNSTYSCCTLDDQGHGTVHAFCFNRLIDPGEVASVTVLGVEDEENTTVFFE